MDISNLKEADNVCDIENSSHAVQCYCNNIEYQQASDSNCWILSEVHLNDIIWDHFISQSNIEQLKFNIRPYVNLNFVPSRALLHLKRLREFSIQYANIIELPAYTFANLSSLQEILMPRNQIIDLRPHAFFNLQNLMSVTLDENRIAELHRDVFINTPNLKKLYIDRNILNVIHDRAFEHLHQLEELELSGNQLSNISRDTFVGLKYLKILNLQENQIRMLKDFTFAELSNLRELTVDRNGIKYISDRAFDGLSNLDRLSFSENKLTSLSNELFSGLTNLRFLDLRENSLHTLSYDTISPIMENLKNVTMYFLIEGNEFVCDCRLSWMYLLRNETSNDQIRNTLDELTCQVVHSQDLQNSKDLGHDFEVNKGDIQHDVQMFSESSNLKHLFDIPQEQLPCEEDKQMEQDATSSVLLNTNSAMNVGSHVPVVNIIFIFSLFIMLNS